ncbi:MAG: sigma 54-interacting transcriptional regulator [Desulfovibrionaceae bacterium]|nr:sigma 54-interacting transcriptional regulator [Desulfovibrionaceae bacterium]
MQVLDREASHQRIILDSIAEGVFTVDLDWRITSFNRAAEEITLVPRQKAIGRACHEVFRAEVCRSECMLRRTLATGRPVRNKAVYILRADDRRIPIRVNTNLLTDIEGRVVGGVETFRDLSAIQELRKELNKRHGFDDIIGKNEAMLRLFSLLPRIASSDTTVLIEGATGTGKELVARALHNNSKHCKGAFIPVNCGALPVNLCESELFGYAAGAFTDAKKDKPGRFALAKDGTIFLDEIGDIALPVQTRLLRVLEEKVYEPLGSTKRIKTNARVVAATNRDIEDLVRQGRFRGDLYFRLNVIRLSLPPIEERKEDIPLLTEHFVSRFNHLTGKKIMGLSPGAMTAFMLYDWPGNVRELENAVEHAFVLCQDRLIDLKHLPGQMLPGRDAQSQPAPGLTLMDVERRAIQAALIRSGGKKMIAARELGIDKNTLRRKIKRLGIQASGTG